MCVIVPPEGQWRRDFGAESWRWQAGHRSEATTREAKHVLHAATDNPCEREIPYCAAHHPGGDEMRGKGFLFVAIMLACMVGVATAAQYYRISSVRRIDKDLYKAANGLYIETRYCYHYAYGEDAILKWEYQGSIGNKIIWDDDTTCDVARIWKK
jgi:hypothetical protein